MMHNFLLYIDPGTDSLLFQALLSAFFTGIVFVKRIKFFLLSKFSGFKKSKDKINKSLRDDQP